MMWNTQKEGKVRYIVLMLIVLVGFMSFGQGVDQEEALDFIDAPNVPLTLGIDTEGLVRQSGVGVVGDFNNDGRADIVELILFPFSSPPFDQEGNDVVVTFLSERNGGFKAPIYSPIGKGSYASDSIAVGDFDEDGSLDVAVGSSGLGEADPRVYVLLGDGQGHFTSQTTEPVPVGRQPTALAPADFNEDGHLDLAVACAMSDEIYILTGSGTGALLNKFNLELEPGAHPHFLVAGDLDQDGHIDLVLANPGDDAVSVAFGDGDGRFVRGNDYHLIKRPSCLALADFNADGYLDVAATNLTKMVSLDPLSFKTYVSVLLGKDNGQFAEPTHFEISGKNPYWLIAADFNLDTHIDLVSSNYTTNDLSILLGDGQGGFQGAPCAPLPVISGFPTGKNLSLGWIGAGDFNGDRYLDLAIAIFDGTVIKLSRIGGGEIKGTDGGSHEQR
jgi:hypothetical protein